MINILTAPLPSFLEISKEKYPINTDFRTWISVSETLFDSEISAPDKIIRAFPLIFRENKIPSDISKTLTAISDFLLPFQKRGVKANRPRGGSPLLSFSQDGRFIYSAFLSQYAIDLTASTLHWWQFLALLSSLNPCKLTEIIKIRGTNLSEISDKNQRNYLKKMKRLYRLTDNQPDFSYEIGKLL